jgi:hypothetical protein
VINSAGVVLYSSSKALSYSSMLNYESYKSNLFSLIFWMNEELLRQSATSILVPLL